MTNPFDYLYYKLHKASLRIDSPGFATGWMAGLLYFNFFTISTWLTGDKDFSNTSVYVVGFILIIVLILVYYAPSKRHTKAIAKYENESEKSRVIGNIAVLCYVILSVVSLILVVV